MKISLGTKIGILEATVITGVISRSKLKSQERSQLEDLHFHVKWYITAFSRT